MESLRRSVNQIAYTSPSQRLNSLSILQLSLIPVLYFASSLYKIASSFRNNLYRTKILAKHRLPVPVISVGNLTWGGNGKTPMVEFIARLLVDHGISPLILTRGYGGADEAKMLQRHLHGTPAKIGVGANRVSTAFKFLENYGYKSDPCSKKLLCEEKFKLLSNSDQIGAAILDDGMQHLSLWRDLEIVMVNAMMPWGNRQLLPLGPLREPLTSLNQADIIVINHADLVHEKAIKALESTIREFNKSVPIFLTKMAPKQFFKPEELTCEISLEAVKNMTLLCVSGIGFAESFVQRVKSMGPRYLDRLDFSDHHLFRMKDIEMVRSRLQELENRFAAKPIVVVTEKDYDRAPDVLKNLKPYEVLVLCCRLQILPHDGRTKDRFKEILRGHFDISLAR